MCFQCIYASALACTSNVWCMVQVALLFMDRTCSSGVALQQPPPPRFVIHVPVVPSELYYILFFKLSLAACCYLHQALYCCLVALCVTDAHIDICKDRDSTYRNCFPQAGRHPLEGRGSRAPSMLLFRVCGRLL